MKLSDEQQARLKKSIRFEIDQCNIAKRQQMPWWAEVRKMKLARATDQSVQIIKGIIGRYMPLYRPKRNGVIDTTFSAFTSIDPIVQMIDPSQGGSNLTFAQKSCANLAHKGGFYKEFKDALGWALDVNLGTLRCTPVTEEGKVRKLKIESIPPTRMVGWPMGLKEYKDLKTVGHFYYDLVARVREKCGHGNEFDLVEDPDTIKGGSDPYETSLKNTQGYGTRGGGPMDANSLDPLDYYVQIYDLVTEFNFDKDSSKRTKITVIYDYRDDVLLAVDKFAATTEDDEDGIPFPMWYVPVRATWDSEEGWLPEDSIGRPCIGIQEIYNRNVNTIQQGGMFAAFGFHLITGGGMKTKVIKMLPGGMYEAPTGVKLEQATFPFDPRNLQFINDLCEKTMDVLMGRTQLGTGANIAASTSAAAVNAMQQGQAESKDGYIDTVAPAVQELFELIWFFLQTYYPDLSEAMPKDIDIPNYEQIKDIDPEFQVTGQSTASNPQGLVQKLMAIIAMLAEPIQLPPGSPFDINKIHQSVIDAMDLPFSTKQLMHTILQDSTGETKEAVEILLAEGWTPTEIKRGLTLFMQSRLQAMQQQQAMMAQQQEQQNAQPQPVQGGPGSVPPAPAQPAPNNPQGGGPAPAGPGMAPPQEASPNAT